MNPSLSIYVPPCSSLRIILIFDYRALHHMDSLRQLLLDNNNLTIMEDPRSVQRVLAYGKNSEVCQRKIINLYFLSKIKIV